MSRKTGKAPTATKNTRAGRALKRDTAGPKAENMASTSKTCPTGLAIPRLFTKAGEDVLAKVKYARRGTKITNPDGSVVFQMDGAEIPADWSQLATDIMISKYFRKAQVPQYKEGDNPLTAEPLKDDDGAVILGPERSARQVVHRLAGCWRDWGERYGYFRSGEDAQAYYDEMCHMLIHQYAAPNSPQWFNTGLAYAYGLTGPGQGHFYVDPDTGVLTQSKDAYTHPQPHACFIQAVSDDLVGKGGIMDLWTREARLFKYGSGTGTNFSRLRGDGEPLSGGGQSSGLMSFLKVGDRAAGAIKSGGTTRRAAKMVCLDLDHPDIVEFINWKAHEENKAKILIDAGLPADFNGEAYGTVSGQNSNNSVRVPSEFIDSVRNDGDWHLRWRTDRNHISKTVKARDLWDQIAKAAWQCADPGVQYDTIINDWHTCPQDGRINASNPCVTGDTLVATDKGWRRIDSLLESPARVVGSDGRLHDIKPAFATGVKPVYRLRTKSGLELKLTGDHRVLTANRGDVPACELSKDDVLILKGAGFGEQKLDAGMAEFIGLMLGDGCLMGEQQTAMLTLAPNEEAVAKRVHDSLTAYRNANAADARAARDIEINRPQGTLRIGTSARCVVDLVSQYAVLDQGSALKAFKAEAWKLDRDGQAALLRGLFTADGTVAQYGDKSQYISLDSTSQELLLQTQLLLLNFGIKSKLYRNRRVAGQTTALLPDGKGGRKEYPVEQIHSLRISRSSRVLFEQQVGFVAGSDKVEALAKLNREVSTYADRLEDLVAELEFLGEEPVYDLTEPDTHHFVANGIVVHNCSEYMFLDDTACNLASLNLVKFFDADKAEFDVPAIQHATRLWTITLEISVLMAQFPSEEIAQKSYDYRTLGLGYANFGTCLMLSGIPYDSKKAMAVCGAVTALMTGESYAASAEMAAGHGPFARYKANQKDMLRVMRNHRRAAYNTPGDEYEQLTVKPLGINPEFCPDYLLDAARGAWDRALELGKQHGYRNAQTTVIAPTGTIGLLMDCDTTGIEPDFALVKFKKLAGGGYFKIINQSVEPALKHLGYSERERRAIVEYAIGTLTLKGAPHINDESLRGHGLTEADISRVETALQGALELGFAVNPWVLGEDTMTRLGIKKEKWGAPGFSLLKEFGFDADEIEAASDHICGRQTVEGAPFLKQEHLPVFDCANRCGKHGKRFIQHMGHVKMMAAAQPFISGAISKTINMPNEVTVQDIEEAYMQAHDLGLKAVAIYRDGSKHSQVLSTSSKKKEDKADAPRGKATEVLQKEVAAEKGPQAVAESAPPRGLHRRPLPTQRRGFTYELKLSGQKMYLRTGEYLNGELGEIFLDMSKEGATLRSILNCFAIAVSKGLQYGVPLKEFVDTFTFTRFEPQGMVEGHAHIRLATSVVDLVFRTLGHQYLGRTDFLHIKPEEVKGPALLAQQGEDNKDLGVAGEHAAGATLASPAKAEALPAPVRKPKDALNEQMESLMGDAPMCDVCGHITVRNGACYKCLNCGNSMGCS